MANETVKTRSKSTCPCGVRAFNGEGQVINLACDQWKCDVCRKTLSFLWGLRVELGITQCPTPAYHVTLTLPGQVKTPAFGFFVLKRAWTNYRQTMLRRCRKFDYAAFVELHPRRLGIAHVHVISLQECPERINDFAHHAGFGFKAQESVVEGRQAARYVSKYTSKQGAAMPKGFRRVRVSRRWPKLPEQVYEIPVYPPGRKEEFTHYLNRIATITGESIPDLMARWEYPEYDL